MYKTMLIGCGSIGALKDDKFDSPTTKNVLTHAHGIYENENFQLTTLVDWDKEKLRQAHKKWNAGNMTQYTHYAIEEEHDVVVIAVDTKHHLKTVQQIFSQKRWKPKLIILEKPAGGSLKECNMIRNLSIVNEAPIMVNYNRRYEHFHWIIKNKIHEVLKAKGKIYSCILKYGRGSIHDGCHAMDLINYWFGPFKRGVKLDGVREDGLDESYKMHLEFDKCDQVIWVPIDSKHYGIFEMDIISSHWIMEIRENGLLMNIRGVKDEENYGDYKVIDNTWMPWETLLTSTMTQLYLDAENYLLNHSDIICSINDAYNVWSIYNRIEKG